MAILSRWPRSSSVLLPAVRQQFRDACCDRFPALEFSPNAIMSFPAIRSSRRWSVSYSYKPMEALCCAHCCRPFVENVIKRKMCLFLLRVMVLLGTCVFRRTPASTFGRSLLIDLYADGVFISISFPVGSPYVFNGGSRRYPPLSSRRPRAINTLSGDTKLLLKNHWSFPVAVLSVFPQGLDKCRPLLVTHTKAGPAHGE